MIVELSFKKIIGISIRVDSYMYTMIVFKCTYMQLLRLEHGRVQAETECVVIAVFIM